jgi:Flp pilus assembly protein TadD
MATNLSASLALAAYQQGDLNTAERWANEALRAAPRDAQTLLAWGVVMHARDQYPAAAQAFRSLTQLQPREPAHWTNLATAERAAGNLDSAAAGYDRAAALGGWTTDLLYNSAMLELQRGDVALGRERLAAAASQRPVAAEIGCRHAQLLMQSGEPAALRAAVRDWQQWQGWTLELLAEMGMLLLTVGEQADALGIMERLRLQDENPLSVEITLVTMLERTNQLDEANERLGRLLAKPDLEVPPAHRQGWLGLRAQLASRNDRHAEAIALYREMLDDALPLAARQEILFPLAKELDADRQYEAAFDAAVAAHESQMAGFELLAPGAESDDADTLMDADAGCDPADVARWSEPEPPTMEESPVFIVAFPRSGTTLLEQMLDAHPGLQTMDEQRFLLDAQQSLQAQGLDYPSGLGDATPAQLAQARRCYWQQVATKVGLEPGQRLLDKNPLNMLRLPVIRRLWPNAPVLLAIRHPFDVITSNYFQHFRAPDFARLCRDLPSLADAYARIFDFWYSQADILHPKVLEVGYEAFVSDFENQAREIARFCGLPWDSAMLEPSKHALARGYIATPSYHQVVRPVNRGAVDRWRRYEPHLLPLQGRVAHLMQRWGYTV